MPLRRTQAGPVHARRPWSRHNGSGASAHGMHPGDLHFDGNIFLPAQNRTPCVYNSSPSRPGPAPLPRRVLSQASRRRSAPTSPQALLPAHRNQSRPAVARPRARTDSQTGGLRPGTSTTPARDAAKTDLYSSRSHAVPRGPRGLPPARTHVLDGSFEPRGALAPLKFSQNFYTDAAQ